MFQSVLFTDYLDYHVYLILYLTFQKVLEMVFYTLVQYFILISKYYLLIFVLNIRRTVSFFLLLLKSVAYLEPRRLTTMGLFLYSGKKPPLSMFNWVLHTPLEKQDEKLWKNNRFHFVLKRILVRIKFWK